MDIWDYFLHREREVAGASLSVDELVFEAAADERAGHMTGRLTLRADSALDAYLKITEWVVLDEGGFVVEKYAYYLIVNGIEARAWEKDARHHEQPVHGHVGANHERVAADEVTLEQALGLAWSEATEATAEDYAG